MTIVEFLTARLDEDEQAAREAAEHGEGIYDSPMQARFWSPRVLREVEAKRHILRDYEQDVFYGEEVLRVLAAVYADHPDYRQKWQPI